jgi:hypothetical protein
MEISEIISAANQELQWLKYYANAETKQKFDPAKSPYEQLRSIGYTKRVIPLDHRCSFLRLTSGKPLKESAIDDMVPCDDYRNPAANILTALEIVLLKFPEEHDRIAKELQ